MATTPQNRRCKLPQAHEQLAAGEGQDATSGCTSRAWARTTRPRGADHRARRGLLRLRRARQALPRRAVRAVLRERRPRPRRSSARRPPRRSRSSASTPTGATPTRARSSWPTRIAALAPGDLNRVFFTSGGSEAVESALEARRGPTTATTARRSRTRSSPARSPTTAPRSGRSPRPASPTCARRSSRSTPGGRHVPNTNSYRWPEDRDPLWAADAIEERILFEGPETVAAVILEPVQNAGGCFVPQDGLLPARARDLRPLRRAADLRRGDLLVGPARPLVRLRALRLRAGHHHDGEGLTSAYAPMGAVIASDRVAEPFMRGHERCSPTASRSAAIRCAAAVALANLDIFEREDLCGHVLREGGRVPRHARRPARHPDRRRRARRRLLPRDRAGQGPGDQGELRRRGVGGAAARLPLRRALPSAG